MPKYTFRGDIFVPGTITIEADSQEAAVALVNDGSSLADMNAVDHSYEDQHYSCLGFGWDNEDPKESENG